MGFTQLYEYKKVSLCQNTIILYTIYNYTLKPLLLSFILWWEAPPPHLWSLADWTMLVALCSFHQGTFAFLHINIKLTVSCSRAQYIFLVSCQLVSFVTHQKIRSFWQDLTHSLGTTALDNVAISHKSCKGGEDFVMIQFLEKDETKVCLEIQVCPGICGVLFWKQCHHSYLGSLRQVF